MDPVFLAVLAPTIIAAVGGVIGSWMSRSTERKLEKRGDELFGAQNAVAQLLDEWTKAGSVKNQSQGAPSPGDLELLALWTANQKLIKYYHDLAIQQSKRSFFGAQFSTYLGFAIVIAVGVYASLAKDGTAAIAAAVVGAAGAALSGFIAATFIKSQTEASSQLKEFFRQPFELSRFLMADRFLQAIEDPALRATTTSEGIKALMSNAISPPNSEKEAAPKS